MKKSISRIAVFVLLSVFIGLFATTLTSRLERTPDRQLNTDCGASIKVSTQENTKLHGCILSTYGWPVQYVKSGVSALVRDYSIILWPNDPSDAGSIIGYTSFSRMRFTVDWALWSAASAAVLGGAVWLTKAVKRPAPAKPVATSHSKKA